MWLLMGNRICKGLSCQVEDVIETGQSYDYYFINHGFNNYEFLWKRPTDDRR